MNGVFIDSSVFLDFLEGKEKAKTLLEEYSGLDGCINENRYLYLYLYDLHQLLHGDIANGSNGDRYRHRR